MTLRDYCMEIVMNCMQISILTSIGGDAFATFYFWIITLIYQSPLAFQDQTAMPFSATFTDPYLLLPPIALCRYILKHSHNKYPEEKITDPLLAPGCSFQVLYQAG